MMSGEDPCGLSAVALAKALARRDISAREVLEAHLARIAAYNGKLNAFITVDADGARRQADACDAAREPVGPLHGLPVAVKDLTNTQGLRTTFGSLLFKDNVPAEDELAVARLRRAGAVIVGKTNTPEFGFGAVCTNRLCGPTRNPFDTELTSGGSSGGGAVAVATGMTPLAHGTDFGGSVRTPASFCDVVSIRPTPGRIAVPLRPLGWDMLATQGLLARHVDDLELGLNACVGADSRDPLSARVENGRLPDRQRPKLAVTSDFGVSPVANEVRARFADACTALAGIAGVEENTPDCAGAIETFRTLRAAHVADSFGTLLKDRHAELTPTAIWNIEAGAKLTAQDYLTAERRRTAIYRGFDALLTHHDFIVAPAASVLPWRNDEGDVMQIDGQQMETPIDYLAVTFIVSLVGFPVLTMPMPRTPEQKPFGVQIIAAPGEEERLFAFGRSIEEQIGCGQRPLL
jgi:amidase